MPRFCSIECKLHCPACNKIIDNGVDIQWGKTPTTMKIGEKIEWARLKSGDIKKPFTIYANSKFVNFGDPSIKNLYVLDSNYYAYDVKNSCPYCSIDIASVVVEIRNEVVTNVNAVTMQNLLEKFGNDYCGTDIIIINEDDSYTYKNEWDDPVLTVITS